MRSLSSTHRGPKSSRLAYWVGRAYLTVAGWDTEGDLPEYMSKGILIAAPHTSNWDLPFMLAVAWVYRLDLSWIGKHTLFESALGNKFFTWLGGIPVDRRARHGAVGQIIDRFDATDQLYIAIAPMGTRSKGKHWKSGFYHMAHGASVPIICGFLDYDRKRAGVGPVFVPTGDVKADMDRLRAFYEKVGALRPELKTDIRLADEEPAPLREVAE